MGHTKVRCKKEPAPADESGFDGGFDAANGADGGDPAPEPASQNWEQDNAAAEGTWAQAPRSDGW